MALYLVFSTGWDTSYSDEEQRALIASLPAKHRVYERDPDTGRLRCPIDTAALFERPHLKQSISKLRTELEEGYHEVTWLNQARKATELRLQGVFDNYLMQHAEEVFGPGARAGESAQSIQTTTVDISLLLQGKDDDAQDSVSSATATAPATTSSSPCSSASPVSASLSATTNASSAVASANYPTLGSRPSIPAKRSASSTDLVGQYPAKKQSKWSSDEDARIIQLRGDGMKWEDISKHLPGRSAISCRLHYQNYLERRSEWDEDRKNKLARLYERFKADMWSRIAEEMAIPWRAAEAMHWQMGESEMAKRAGVSLFTLVNTNSNPGSSTGSSCHPWINTKIRRINATTLATQLAFLSRVDSRSTGIHTLPSDCTRC
ncbi:hypothetical protein DV736_g1049, partial [Chaetothyriales sp. CBS 134916]